MKTPEDIRIETLLEHFFEGDTSLAEEEELYAFFAKSALPERWQRYKPLFGFFTTGLAETATALSPRAGWQNPISLPPAPLAPVASSSPGKKKKRIPIFRIACACVAVFLSGLFIYPLLPSGNAAADPYAGSYLVRDGIRITDPELIRPEVEATLSRVALLEKEMKKKLRDGGTEKTASQAIDNQLKRVYIRLLAPYPEGFVRNEARKMLNVGAVGEVSGTYPAEANLPEEDITSIR